MKETECKVGTRVITWTGTGKPGDCNVSLLGGEIISEIEPSPYEGYATVIVRYDFPGFPDERVPIHALRKE